ncbi:thylakoid lumenal 17.4 kDa protein, chloroplastic isoform X2 [Cucumis melo]|uniref:Thylakoid lumenal 17.4 kDa protein, chloroplastic isoform X2 n=1 Tax=Cucumis melo TaxID=3656 RepID=A0ABM3KYH2_CUCME|nr:thylakoid lumenal 17.4 kDa protein, chloroplastic isoform X2 [Cucumis melo]
MATLSIPPSQNGFSRSFFSTKRPQIVYPFPHSLPRITCSATRDGAKPRENLSPCKHISTVACGLLAVWALTNTSPVIAANQRQIVRRFTLGKKPVDLIMSGTCRGCLHCLQNPTDLKGKSLAAALMSDAKFDGADLSEVVMSKAYAVGASFKGVDFSNAVLDRVNFGKANLQGALFKNTVLSGSTFDDAQLQDAVFEDTIIGYIDLQKLCVNPTISPEGRAELGCR